MQSTHHQVASWSSWGMLPYWSSALVSAIDMLACWALNGSSQSSLDKGKSMLLSSCITSIPINMVTLLISKLWSSWGKKLTAVTDEVI